MERAFYKFQAIGNDYILFDAVGESLQFDPATVARLCDRRLGIGADGILIVDRPSAAYRMEIINSDGSLAMMCGNGLRSVVKFLVDAGYEPAGGQVAVETRSGMRGGVVLSRSGMVSVVRVDVGAPRVVADERLAGRDFTIVDVGNPHAVSLVEPDEDPVALALSIGPQVERVWDGGINVGFYRPTRDTALELAVWERGAGYTLACGTGATAAFATVLHRGTSGTAPMRIVQPGGALQLELQADGHVLLTGESERVFSGVWQMRGHES